MLLLIQPNTVPLYLKYLDFKEKNVFPRNILLYLPRGYAVTVYPHWVNCNCGDRRISFDSILVAQIDVSLCAENQKVSLANLYQEYLR